MADAISHVKTTTTDVRIAVARFASTPATPTLARIAVSAAKKAESSDQVNQVICFQYARNRYDSPRAPAGPNLTSIVQGFRSMPSQARPKTLRRVPGVTLNLDATDFLRVWNVIPQGP